MPLQGHLPAAMSRASLFEEDADFDAKLVIYGAGARHRPAPITGAAT